MKYFILCLDIMAAKRRNVKPRRRNKKQNTSFDNAVKKMMKLSTSQRMQAMKSVDNKFINEISKRLKKLRYARVSPKMQKQLKRHSKTLRKFTSRKTSMTTKRRMLTKGGGGGKLTRKHFEMMSLIGNNFKNWGRSMWHW